MIYYIISIKKHYNIKCQGLVRVALAKVRIRKGPPAVAQKTSQIKGEVKLTSSQSSVDAIEKQ